MKKITVFTPTYNRAYCLHQLYESLCRQTSQDFEWLIIDDGSNDNTKELVESWVLENKVRIKYHFKQNGGMHTGHNKAYEFIQTELSMCIDSDDFVTDDGIEKIITFWNVNGSDEYGGIYALDAGKDGKIIGDSFPNDLKEFEGWGKKYIFYDNKKYKVKGDKKFIGVTKKIKQYPPIPVFEGEKFYGLYYKQHFIEQNYKILILNEPVCIVEYMPDGSSMNIFKQYLNNPLGFQHMRMNMMQIAPNFEIRFMQAIHYINSCLILKDYNFFKKELNFGLILLALAPGIGLYFYTLRMSNKLKKIKTI